MRDSVNLEIIAVGEYPTQNSAKYRDENAWTIFCGPVGSSWDGYNFHANYISLDGTYDTRQLMSEIPPDSIDYKAIIDGGGMGGKR